MPKPNDTKKSAHYEALEAQFEQKTRRFSPFEVLGLTDQEVDAETPTTHTGVDSTHTHEDSIETNAENNDHVSSESPTTDEISDEISEAEPLSRPSPTHTGVGSTHAYGDPTHKQMASSHTDVDKIHSRVVDRSNTADLNTTTLADVSYTHMDDPSTHTGVDSTHRAASSGGLTLESDASYGRLDTQTYIEDTGREGERSQSAQSVERLHDVLAATNLRAQVGQKAKQVLAYLNSIRSVENPAYTVSVGYGQIAASADVSTHYLRRDVLPKLAMIGLIGIVRKSFQGTIYHLHYDYDFIRVVSLDESEAATAISQKIQQPTVPMFETVKTGGDGQLPEWIDREAWGWMALETAELLVQKAGSPILAEEKLAIILYNESHGPEERRVRDRRAVLAHYLRSPQADIWPNDDGYETLGVRRARQERDQALHEKELAEETLKVRLEAAKARFLASLDDEQHQWLKREAKLRVDTRPDAKFLTSRYPLYKAEEEVLVQEWMDRVTYGEAVPRVSKVEEDGIVNGDA